MPREKKNVFRQDSGSEAGMTSQNGRRTGRYEEQVMFKLIRKDGIDKFLF